MFEFVSRETGDEILHVEVAAKSSTFEDNLSSVSIDYICAADAEN